MHLCVSKRILLFEFHYSLNLNFVMSAPDPPANLSVCQLKEVSPRGEAHSHLHNRVIRFKYDVSSVTSTCTCMNATVYL